MTMWNKDLTGKEKIVMINHFHTLIGNSVRDSHVNFKCKWRWIQFLNCCGVPEISSRVGKGPCHSFARRAIHLATRSVTDGSEHLCFWIRQSDSQDEGERQRWGWCWVRARGLCLGYVALFFAWAKCDVDFDLLAKLKYTSVPIKKTETPLTLFSSHSMHTY